LSGTHAVRATLDPVDERRAAERVLIDPEIDATISGVPVRIVELSAVGGRIEHEGRFALASPELQIVWQGESMFLPARVVRSEIVGRSGSKLMYRTGIRFTGDPLRVERLLSAILRPTESRAAEDPPLREPQPKILPPPQPAQLDDTWTRQVKFLDSDPEDALPYAQFRQTADGWKKSYVASPEQPQDGFTIPRDQRDFPELQRTFECADPETRRMMQIALRAQLEARQAG
jgi:hypothetical protein